MMIWIHGCVNLLDVVVCAVMNLCSRSFPLWGFGDRWHRHNLFAGIDRHDFPELMVFGIVGEVVRAIRRFRSGCFPLRRLGGRCD